MNTKSFIMVAIFLFLLLAQDTWAVSVSYVAGEIYVETGTSYLSGGTWSASGWSASDGVFTSSDFFSDSIGAYGYASGQKIDGQTGSNNISFFLASTAQSANGSTQAAFYTYATVRSGPNPGDMIIVNLTPDPGEEGKPVEVTSQAILAGALNSSGLTFLDPAWESGEASVDFTFKIYKDPTQDAVMSLEYSDSVKNESPTAFIEKSKSLPGHIGKKISSGTFLTGDRLYIYFEQTVTATVSNSLQCGAKAYTIQTTTNNAANNAIRAMNNIANLEIDAQVITGEDLTIIELDQFTAAAGNNQITLTWTTLSEIDNAGFNLWRSEAENGKYSRINSSIIGAKGGATLGAEYSYTDDTAKAGVRYYYKLEDIDTKGISTFYRPISTSIPTRSPIPAARSGNLPFPYYYWFECYPLWSRTLPYHQSSFLISVLYPFPGYAD